MEKKEYIRRALLLREERDKFIEDMNRREQSLNEDYLKENCKFSVGDTVEYDDERGVINKCFVVPRSEGEIGVLVKPYKEDGTGFKRTRAFLSGEFDNLKIIKQ